MSEIYAIGDVQGCAESLKQLVASLPLEKGDTLWFVGDIVNRGPSSLEALRWVQRAVDAGDAVTVLGNHDLHLLAVQAGVRALSRKDTFHDILDAPDADELLDWLARQPLLSAHGTRALVHAGLFPSWTLSEAVARADELHEALVAGERAFLAEPHASSWSPTLPRPQRLATALAGLTRIRAVHADGSFEPSYKGTLDDMPSELQPWFDAPRRRSTEHEIVFGHWAALGLHLANGLVATDTGCVWGGALTAVRLNDRRVFSQPRVEPPESRHV